MFLHKSKELINSYLRRFGFEVQRKSQKIDESLIYPVEFSSEEIEIIKYVLDRQLTQLSIERLIASVSACKFVIEQNIEGDIVECGVWRGGNAILMTEILRLFGSRKKIWLYDTFSGMTYPSEKDRDIHNIAALPMYKAHQKEGFNESLGGPASIEQVRKSFGERNLLTDSVKFVLGDVRSTLLDRNNLPNSISVLRLDTDWYDSTKLELEVLYPKLTTGGILLVDDYGHWQGARLAVDEYFRTNPPKPFLAVTDYTGRSGQKLCVPVN